MGQEVNIRKIQTFAAASFARSMRLIMSHSRATTVTECKAMISALQIATEYFEVVEQSTEGNLAALLLKLDYAINKRDQAKFHEAICELADFRDKVQKLDEQGKVDHDDAGSLAVCASDSIACIQGIRL